MYGNNTLRETRFSSQELFVRTDPCKFPDPYVNTQNTNCKKPNLPTAGTSKKHPRKRLPEKSPASNAPFSASKPPSGKPPVPAKRPPARGSTIPEASRRDGPAGPRRFLETGREPRSPRVHALFLGFRACLWCTETPRPEPGGKNFFRLPTLRTQPARSANIQRERRVAEPRGCHFRTARVA